MLRCVGSLLALVALPAVTHGADITIPLNGGAIVISAQVRETTELAYRIIHPESKVYDFVYQIENHTSSRWRIIRLRFDLGGLCDGKPKQWSIPIVVSPLAHSVDFPWVEKGIQPLVSSVEPIKLGQTTSIPLPDLERCSVEIIKAVLSSAESDERDKVTIAGTTPEPLDLTSELIAIQARKDAEAAAQAKTSAAYAAEQAKKDAADEARRKQLAAEQKKKDAEQSARTAMEDARQAARIAEDRRKVRAACAAIYKDTADTKLKDLTVKEEQQVRTCQALGLYSSQ